MGYLPQPPSVRTDDGSQLVIDAPGAGDVGRTLIADGPGAARWGTAGGGSVAGAVSFDATGFHRDRSAGNGNDGGTELRGTTAVVYGAGSAGPGGWEDTSYPGVTVDADGVYSGFRLNDAGWWVMRMRATALFPSSAPTVAVAYLRGAWLERSIVQGVPILPAHGFQASPYLNTTVVSDPFWADADDFISGAVWWNSADDGASPSMAYRFTRLG